ncbi:17599_t:CDS:10, partial [Acaulospora morrowiae]
DRIFSQFNIEHNDRENYAFHVTEIGKKEIGPSISDDELIQECMSADDRGTLKLLVKRMRPRESSYGIPSQPHKRSPSNTLESSPSFNSGDSRYRRPAPYSPHSEVEQSYPPINEEQRRFPNFTGGFNPRIQDRWNVGVISEEPSDSNKFKDFQDVRFPVPHIDQPGGQISAYPSRHRKTGSGDQYRSPNRGGNHTSQKPQRIHPPALQPGRRNNALLSATHGSGLYPRKLSKSQPNLPFYQAVPANYNARVVSEPEQRYQPKHPVISEPDLARRGQVILPESEEKPLWPKITSLTDNEVSFWAEEPKPTSSIPNDHDDANDGIWADEPMSTSSISNDHNDLDDGVWAKEPKLTSSIPNDQDDLDDGIWAKEPKPTSSIPNDQDDFDDGIWAKEPKPTSSIPNDQDDFDDGIWAKEPKPTSSIPNDQDDLDDGIWAKEPKPTSSIPNDQDDLDDGIWAKEPKPTSSIHNDQDDLDNGIWAKEPKPTSSIPNDRDDLNDGIWAKEPKPTSSIPNDRDDFDDEIWAEKPKPSKNDESSNDKQSTVLQRPDLGDSAISLSHDTPFENPDQSIKRIDAKSKNSKFPTRLRESKSLKRAVSQRKGEKMEESWIERPNAEDINEDLEQYFPGHDLDMPIAEAHGSVQSVSEDGDSSRVASVPEKPKISRGKSIRVAASEARERERRERKTKTQNIVNTEVNEKKLTRKPTTKLWGRRVVEEIPSSKKKIPCPNSTSDEGCSERKPVKWVKGELIGKGSFGKVYLAINLTSSEILAVKQIKLPRTKMDQRTERQKALIKSFKDEMEILKDLDHEHIVTYIGYEENDDTANIFLEYVNGGSIGTVLRMYGAFKEPVVRSFTRQILLGLEYLHEKSILHRDIKADNILVDEEGCCKISDFGISKKYEHGYGHDYNSMSLKGTIFWMAPEVFTNNYSVKMDIWSLGCVVLEMFAGERPWSDLEDLPAMYMLGTEKKAPPIREDIVMSDDARDFLNKCFIIEPCDRPTADQLSLHPFTIEKPGFRFKDYIKIPS